MSWSPESWPWFFPRFSRTGNEFWHGICGIGVVTIKPRVMTPFIPVSEPFEGDFYSIEMCDGVKCIHINGYTYKSDCLDRVTEDNPWGVFWASLEVCWFLLPLAEFIQNLRADYNYVDDTYCELKQYQEDFTEEEMVNVINTYFNGDGADGYLHFEDLTEDTPCGHYINKLDLVIR